MLAVIAGVHHVDRLETHLAARCYAALIAWQSIARLAVDWFVQSNIFSGIIRCGCAVCGIESSNCKRRRRTCYCCCCCRFGVLKNILFIIVVIAGFDYSTLWGIIRFGGDCSSLCKKYLALDFKGSLATIVFIIIIDIVKHAIEQNTLFLSSLGRNLRIRCTWSTWGYLYCCSSSCGT